MPDCPHCGTRIEHCPTCGQPLSAEGTPTQAQLSRTRPHTEQTLWEGKPGFRAGLKSQTLTYRVTSRRVQIVHSGLSHNVEEIDLASFREARVVRSLTQRGSSGNLMILTEDPNASMLMFEDIEEPEQVQEIVRTAAQAAKERRE
jgi:hypothetical protein